MFYIQGLYCYIRKILLCPFVFLASTVVTALIKFKILPYSLFHLYRSFGGSNSNRIKIRVKVGYQHR